MKKTMLALFLAGSCSAAFAQVTETRDTSLNRTQNQSDVYNTQTDVNRTTDMNRTTEMHRTDMQGNHHTIHRDAMSTTGDYSAYGTTSAAVPRNIQVYFDRDYPAAGTVTWRQKGNMYHATYLNQGRYSHVYYNNAGNSYTVSLPVTQNYVPDDVVNRVSNMFGDMVYDIATMRGADGKDFYHVRTFEGDQLKSQWIGEDGVAITDPFRSADQDDAMNPNTMNQNQQNNQQQMNQQQDQQQQTIDTLNREQTPYNQEQTPLIEDQEPGNQTPAPINENGTLPEDDGSTSAIIERKYILRSRA
jgi:hypothetical protein